MGDIPQTRPYLERSEVLQPVAQHGMEVEALATSPLQEMVGPAAQTTRCALNPANPGAPSVVNAPRHPSLAGVCQHTTAGLHDWRAEPSAVRRSSMLGVAVQRRYPSPSLPDDWTRFPS